jgi:hypothetical protein
MSAKRSSCRKPVHQHQRYLAIGTRIETQLGAARELQDQKDRALDRNLRIGNQRPKSLIALAELLA